MLIKVIPIQKPEKYTIAKVISVTEEVLHKYVGDTGNTKALIASLLIDGKISNLVSGHCYEEEYDLDNHIAVKNAIALCISDHSKILTEFPVFVTARKVSKTGWIAIGMSYILEEF